MTTSTQDNEYGTISSSTGGRNLTLAIYNNNEWKQLSPIPFLSVSSACNRNEAGYLNTEYTLTLNGFVSTGGCDDKIANCSYPAASGEVTGAKFAWKAQNYIEDIFGDDKLQIKLAGAGGDLQKRFDCQVESINFEEGDYASYMRYNVVLKSYTGQFQNKDGEYIGMGSSSIPNTSHSRAPFDSGVLTAFNETWSLDPSMGEYGMHRAVNATDQEAISNVYYNGTYSISVSCKRWGNRRKILSTSENYATGTAPGWIVAKDLTDAYMKDTRSSFHTLDLIRSSLNGTSYFVGGSSTKANKLQTYNYTRAESIDTAGGTYTLTDNFIYAPTGMKALETFDVSYSSDSSSNTPTVTVAGTIKGLTQNSPYENSKGYTELEGSTFVNNNNITASGQIGNAVNTYYDISNQGAHGFSRIFNRAQHVTSQHLNTSPTSISYSTNDVAGEVTYSLEFNASPYRYFAGAVYENITVEDTYPGDVYTTIPILGRSTGPILQYLAGRTEYKRTLNVEVVIDSASTSNSRSFPTAKRENLIAGKPSLRAGFKDKITGLVSLYSPANEPGIVNWFQDPPTESWNPTEGRYNLSVSWTYELSE
jgi:hypothetical protein